jgi:tight adherence protein B
VVAVSLPAALAGAGIAAGLWLIVTGVRPRPVASALARPYVRRALDPSEIQQRLPLALALALPTALLTRWPVAAMAIGTAGWFGPELFGSKASHDRATARTEAIAAWTEMLRDTMSGAHGLEQAVVTTAAVAPTPIKPEVTRLAVRLERQPLSIALDEFAADLAHPTGDLVVAALTLASQGSVGDLGELLGTLAVSAREEAGMRLRVDAARARLRTAVRVIAACTASTAIGLLLLNRTYLNVYGSVTGQLTLAVVAVCWGVALTWLAKMSEFVAPERFLAARPDIAVER